MIHTINHPAIGLASAIKSPPGPDTSSNQTPSNGIWSFAWPKALDFLGNHFDALSESPCGQQNFSAHRKGQPYLLSAIFVPKMGDPKFSKTVQFW